MQAIDLFTDDASPKWLSSTARASAATLLPGTNPASDRVRLLAVSRGLVPLQQRTDKAQ